MKARSPGDSNRYVHLDDLKKHLLEKDLYDLVELSDEVMGICFDIMPDRMERCRARSKFVADLGFSFPVGGFSYECEGTLGNWVPVF